MIGETWKVMADNTRRQPDLPLIPILSVYTDFFTLRIWKNTYFLPKNVAKYRLIVFLEIWQNEDFFFQECERVFFMVSLVIQNFPLKYWFSLSFILILCWPSVAGLGRVLEKGSLLLPVLWLPVLPTQCQVKWGSTPTNKV